MALDPLEGEVDFNEPSRTANSRLAVLVIALVLAAHQGATSQTGGTAVLGRVIDGHSRLPVAGAVVTAQGRSQRSFFTGSDGEFAFEGVPPGSMFIEVTRPGYFSGHFAQSTPDSPGRAVPVVGGAVTPVEVTLWPAGAISGRVIDVAGAAVPNAQVVVLTTSHGIDQGASTSPRGPEILTGFVADAAGRYLVDGLRAAEYVLLGVDPHPRGDRERILKIDSASVAAMSAVRLFAAPGEELVDVMLQTEDLTSATSAGCVITGQVSGEHGGPLHASVAALQADGREVRSIRTNARGGYCLADLPPGSYRVVAVPDIPPSGLNTFWGGRVHPVKLPRTFYPDALDSQSASTVVVDGGIERTGIDVSVRLIPEDAVPASSP